MKILRYLVFMALASTMCLACSSGDDDAPVDKPGNETIVPKPTNWTLPADLHYSSMTVVVDESVMPTGVAVSADDLIGAFVADQCRGVAQPIIDIDGRYRFNIVVHSTVSDNNRTDMQVHLKYYSDAKKHIYTTATPFAFVYNGKLGSVEQSYAPQWQ